jgi:hypothetical protein
MKAEIGASSGRMFRNEALDTIKMNTVLDFDFLMPLW